CGLAYIVSMCIYQIASLAATGVFGVGTAAALAFILAFVCLLFMPYREAAASRSEGKREKGGYLWGQ
ncbi:MAG: hypothetical protein K2P89_10275, partial [Lachnospiraceae bacterium]|nr:hypothetical protein [Lachnospiraceae bacterium]